MFNLQGSELIIILLLALVVLGPEKLPEAMRKAGQVYAELKKMSTGFQEEFKSVVDEPMREMRDTANLLRDSADFRKLQDGERAEKPKSADMLAAADPTESPVEDVPTFEPNPDHVADGAPDGEPTPEPETDASSTPTTPAPFSYPQASSAGPRTEPPPATPAPDLFGQAQRSSVGPPSLRESETDTDETTPTPDSESRNSEGDSVADADEEPTE